MKEKAGDTGAGINRHPQLRFLLTDTYMARGGVDLATSGLASAFTRGGVKYMLPANVFHIQTCLSNLKYFIKATNSFIYVVTSKHAAGGQMRG